MQKLILIYKAYWKIFKQWVSNELCNLFWPLLILDLFYITWLVFMVCMGCRCTLPQTPLVDSRVGFLTHGPNVPRGTWNQGLLLEGLGHIWTGHVKGQTHVVIQKESPDLYGFVRSNKKRLLVCLWMLLVYFCIALWAYWDAGCWIQEITAKLIGAHPVIKDVPAFPCTKFCPKLICILPVQWKYVEIIFATLGLNYSMYSYSLYIRMFSSSKNLTKL